MSPRPLALFGLLAILLVAPFAAAQVPTVPTDPLSEVPDPGTELPPAPSTVLDIEENGLTFRGPAGNPSYIAVVAPDGTTAFEYTLDEGRASFAVAGENAIADATLLFIEGNPLGDSFTIALADPQGGAHHVLIDRAALHALMEDVDLPPELQIPPIEIARPIGWPGAPTRSYLLYVEDANKNHLGISQLDGSSFLWNGGTHRAVLQIPIAENEWDRWFLDGRVAGAEEGRQGEFQPTASTDTATIYAASFGAGLLNAAEGATIDLDIIYEKRITPLIVERFTDPLDASYRVDGTGPTVNIAAPTTSDSFKFTVSWQGTDDLSGIGGFTVDYRAGPSGPFNRWLDKSPDTSALFSGDWGKSYEFRAKSLDAVGNPSEFVGITTVIVAKPSDDADINDAPKARITSPTSASTVAGATTIRWEASDEDGTPVSSKLEISADDGLTWRLLYNGQLKSVPWDTTMEQDGAGYSLRLTVSDGTLTASDVRSAITIRNVVAPPAPPAGPTPDVPPTPGAPSAPTPGAPAGSVNDDATGTPASDDSDGAGGEGKNGIPMPFVGVAIAGAALLMRRKRT